MDLSSDSRRTVSAAVIALVLAALVCVVVVGHRTDTTRAIPAERPFEHPTRALDAVRAVPLAGLQHRSRFERRPEGFATTSDPASAGALLLTACLGSALWLAAGRCSRRR